MKKIVPSTILENNSQQKYSLGDHLECPVCRKEFEVSDDTKYIIGKKYTCSWECFLDYVNKHPRTYTPVFTEMIKCQETGELFKNLKDASEKYHIKYSDAYKSYLKGITVNGYTFLICKVEKPQK